MGQHGQSVCIYPAKWQFGFKSGSWVISAATIFIPDLR